MKTNKAFDDSMRRVNAAARAKAEKILAESAVARAYVVAVLNVH